MTDEKPQTRYAKDKAKRESQARHGDIVATLGKDVVAEFNDKVIEHKPKCVTKEFPSPWTDWDRYREQSEEGEVPMPSQETAEEMCAGCPIAEQMLCLRYALATNQTHGVWNGKRIYNGRIVTNELGNGSAPGWR